MALSYTRMVVFAMNFLLSDGGRGRSAGSAMLKLDLPAAVRGILKDGFREPSPNHFVHFPWEAIRQE